MRRWRWKEWWRKWCLVTVKSEKKYQNGDDTSGHYNGSKMVGSSLRCALLCLLFRLLWWIDYCTSAACGDNQQKGEEQEVGGRDEGKVQVHTSDTWLQRQYISLNQHSKHKYYIRDDKLMMKALTFEMNWLYMILIIHPSYRIPFLE